MTPDLGPGSILLLVSTAAAAAASFAVAGAAVRTADAFFTLFLGTNDVPSSKADDQCDHADNNQVVHSYLLKSVTWKGYTLPSAFGLL